MTTVTNNLDLIFTNYLTKHRSDSVQIVEFEPGQTIIKEGHPMRNFYFTFAGKTKVFKEYENGKTFLLGFFGDVDVMGDIEYFHDVPASCTVEVVTPVKAVKLSFEAIDLFYKKDIHFVTNMLLQLSRKVLRNNEITANNMVYPLDVRLASYILSICPDGICNKLPNLDDLSNNLGTSYRHLFRILKSFEDDNLITRSRHSLEIKDPTTLLKIARGNIYESTLTSESNLT